MPTQNTSWPILLIPAYKPGPDLPEIVSAALATGRFQHAVVIDDGSGQEFRPVFESTTLVPGVTLLRHAVNLGKGAALKTAFNVIACSYPQSVGVVTADADGQHSTGDIAAVAAALTATPEALVLGARQFDADVPLRSKFGNTLTRTVVRVLLGKQITDTQTGLRGVPLGFIPDLLQSKSSRYDFELDMLVICRESGRRMLEVPIRTIYLDGNQSSHFNPLIDSMRVYFVFLRFISMSLAAAVMDNVVFFIAFQYVPMILLCQALSRLVSGTFNYQTNKRSVFQSRRPHRVTAPRYILVALATGLVGYFAIEGLVQAGGFSVFPAKIITETSLFLFNFAVQRAFVFDTRSGRD